MILGQCPCCEDGVIEVRKKEVRGKKVKLFACSNAKWHTEDGELWELSPKATCGFKIWQNALRRYGKWFSYHEIKTLLQEGAVDVVLISRRYGKKIEYEKKVVLDFEYGVSVVWSDDEI